MYIKRHVLSDDPSHTQYQQPQAHREPSMPIAQDQSRAFISPIEMSQQSQFLSSFVGGHDVNLGATAAPTILPDISISSHFDNNVALPIHARKSQYSHASRCPWHVTGCRYDTMAGGAADIKAEGSATIDDVAQLLLEVHVREMHHHIPCRLGSAASLPDNLRLRLPACDAWLPVNDPDACERHYISVDTNQHSGRSNCVTVNAWMNDALKIEKEPDFSGTFAAMVVRMVPDVALENFADPCWPEGSVIHEVIQERAAQWVRLERVPQIDNMVLEAWRVTVDLPKAWRSTVVYRPRGL